MSTPTLPKASTSRNPHFLYQPSEDSLNKVHISQIDVSSSLSSATNNAKLRKNHCDTSPHNNSDTTTVKLSHHSSLNSDKQFVITIHSAKVHISSNIQLRFTCQLNDAEIHSTRCYRVDQGTRVANFEDTEFKMKLSAVKS